LTGEQIAHLMRERAMLKHMSQALPTLTSTELSDISAELTMETYQPGDIIVQKGDPATKFYIIAQGEVDVLKQGSDGAEEVLSRLSAGQYFGEMGILRGQNRTRTVRAAENEVEVIAIDRQTFLNLYHDSELTGGEIAQVVQQRLRTS
jgi:CRP-like cAMP-binding protein